MPSIGVVLLLLTAGCMGVGLDGASYDAPPAVVGDNVAEDNQYKLSGVNEFEMNRTVNISENRQYNINARNWVTTYQKKGAISPDVTSETIENETLGMFAVVSTPSVEIAGTELNPLVKTPMGEVLKRVTQESENLEVHEKVGESNVTHKQTGQNVTVEKYDATVALSESGVQTETYIHSAVVKTEDAVLVTIGMYPAQVDDEAAILDMIQSVETTEEPPEVDNSTSTDYNTNTTDYNNSSE